MADSEHPVDRALRLWSSPLPAGDAALDAFRGVYADPLRLNGVASPVAGLVERARMMQAAFEGLRHEILERFHAPGRAAFAFKITGRQTGPLATPLGELAPTGQRVEVFGMDIFVISNDLVTGVWAIADYLGLLMQAEVVDSAQLPAVRSGAAASVTTLRP